STIWCRPSLPGTSRTRPAGKTPVPLLQDPPPGSQARHDPGCPGNTTTACHDHPHAGRAIPTNAPPAADGPVPRDRRIDPCTEPPPPPGRRSETPAEPRVLFGEGRPVSTPHSLSSGPAK